MKNRLILRLGFFFLSLSLGSSPTHAAPVRGQSGDLWADIVIGKSGFGEATENDPDAKRLFNVGGVLVDRSVTPNRLFVYDSGNNRVLVLNSIANLQEGMAANFALGQPDLIHSAANGDSNFQNYPLGAVPLANTLQTMAQDQISLTEGGSFATLAVDSQGNLYVPDFFNNRVLRYNAPFSSNEAAVTVWGQGDFSSNLCNRGGSPSNNSLCLNGGHDGFGAGVAVDGQGNLWVADDGNNRVLRFPFNSSTGLPAATADLVLGQSDFNSNLEASDGDLTHLRTPTSVRVDSSGKVYVTDIPLLPTPIPGGQDCDKYDGQVLIYSPPLSTGMAANQVLKQGLANPGGLELDPVTGGIWVADFCTHQALLFVNGTVQKVLGQDQPSTIRGCAGHSFVPSGPPFLYDDGSQIESDTMCNVRGSIGVASDGSVFLSSSLVQDVWRFPAPIPPFQPGTAYSADIRVFKGHQYGVPNDVDNIGLGNPFAVAVAGTQLIVADGSRILYWNGAPNFTTGQQASGYAGVTNVNLEYPDAMGLIQPDQNGHLWTLRANGAGFTSIQVYNVPFTSSGTMPFLTINPPLPVAGQNGVMLNWSSLAGIAADPAGDQVWVSDTLNHRVIRIRNPLTNPVVDIVLGQTSAAAVGCNMAGVNSPAAYCGPCVDASSTPVPVPPTAASLYRPGPLRLDHHGDLYISDDSLECWGNYRLLRWNASQFPASPASCLFAIPATAVYGRNGSFTSTSCANAPGTPGVCAPWEPAFNSDDSVMVVGLNPYQDNGQRFPVILPNPLPGDTPSGSLNDFTSMPISADFDSGDNLYMTDENRNRVLVYLRPFAAGPASTPTATPTPPLACGTSPAGLQLREFTSLNGNQASENFQVINTGSTPLNLSQVTVKFWVYDTTGSSLVGAVNYGGCYGPTCTAVSGVALAASGFSPACGSDPAHQANWEVILSNTSASTLGAGVTWGNIQTAIHLANYANFSGPASWYSPSSVGGGNTYTNDLHYAVYYQGNLVGASGGTPPPCRAVPTCTPGGATGTPTSNSSPTPTGTPSRTFTATISPTFTATAAASTATLTPTRTATPMVSRTSTATGTSTPTPSPTASPTGTGQATLTSTRTSTAPPTSSPTPASTLTRTATVTVTPTASSTSGAGCGTSSLSLQLREFGACGSNQDQQNFEVINTGTTAVTLSDITIRFWADDTTSGQAMVGAVYYGGCFGQNCTAVNGVGISTLSFSPACGPDPNHQADWEITLSSTDSRTLGAGVTWSNIQTAVHLANFANFSPGTGSWYSPCAVGGGSAYTNDLHYALYVGGNLVTASGGVPPSCRPVPTCTPGGAAPAMVRAALELFQEPTATPTPEPALSLVVEPNVSRDGRPVRFVVSLMEAAPLQLCLYSLMGEKVAELKAQGAPGANTLTWDLTNRSGSGAASGLYLYVLQAKGLTRTGKVVLLH